jgi:hypothetical protein
LVKETQGKTLILHSCGCSCCAAAPPQPLQNSFGSGGIPAITSSSTSSNAKHHSSRFWQLLLPAAAAAGADAEGSSSSSAVFHGLRVRMGVAGGLLPQDCKDVESSWVTARAQSEDCFVMCARAWHLVLLASAEQGQRYLQRCFIVCLWLRLVQAVVLHVQRLGTHDV